MEYHRNAFHYFAFFICGLCLFAVISPTLSGRAGGGGGRRSSSSGRRSSSSWGSQSPSGSSGAARSPSSSSFGSSSASGGSPARANSPSSFGSSKPAGASSSRFGSSSPSGTPGASGSRNFAGAGSGSVGARPSGSALGSSSSKWGSSSPTGNRPSGGARTNYAPAGGSAVRSASNRPAANAPVAGRSPAVQPVYTSHTTIINNNGGGFGGYGHSGFGTGSLLLAGAGGMVGGYLLGSMLTRSLYHDPAGCCYGCGCSYYGPRPPYYYDSYVPYRYRYGDTTSSSVTNNNIVINQYNNSSSSTGGTVNANSSSNGGSSVPPMSNKPIEVCALARWNMELPFTELPNMLLTFLASDNISGDSISAKSKFLYEFINTTAAPYGTLPATSNVFQIDTTFNLDSCNFHIRKTAGGIQSNDALSLSSNGTTARPWFAGAVMQQWREKVRNGDRSVCFIASFAHIPECSESQQGPEEPFITAVNRLQALYSNLSVEQELLTEVVQSAKKCYPAGVMPPKEIIPCLDYSIDVKQASSLENATSIFGNEEVCRKYLNPDIGACFREGSSFPCTISDLTNLNVFARNYYLCKEPVDPELIQRLQKRQSNQNTAGGDTTSTTAAEPPRAVHTDAPATPPSPTISVRGGIVPAVRDASPADLSIVNKGTNFGRQLLPNLLIVMTSFSAIFATFAI